MNPRDIAGERKQKNKQTNKTGCTPSVATTPIDHHLSPRNRPLQTESQSQKDWRTDLSSMPLWRRGPNNSTLPAILLTAPPSKAADMAHLCVPQNQALGSAGELFLTSKYAALTGSERGFSQRNHHVKRRRRRSVSKVGVEAVSTCVWVYTDNN